MTLPSESTASLPVTGQEMTDQEITDQKMTDQKMTDQEITYQDIEAAAQRLDGWANRTPVLTSRTVNQQTGSQVFFKCENFQRAGAFKFRGAFNALAQLSALHSMGQSTGSQGQSTGSQSTGQSTAQPAPSVLTYSSGNHAQAVALAGKLLDLPTTIIMPQDAPAVKLAATGSYGAEVLLYDRTQITREDLAHQLAQERHATLIPPFDHPHVIAGQGTTAKELIEEVGPLDLLLVCCGGGGLLSGCAIAAHTLSPGCRVIGVEPEQGDDATRSFQTKTLQTVYNPQTIADGARTPSLGQLTFPIVLRYVHDMVTVTDRSLLQTMFFLWERLKIVVEPTGALAATALLDGTVKAPGQRVGIIISGGNVDLAQVLQSAKR